MKTKMHPLKNDHCYGVVDAFGMAAGELKGIVGFFFHDARHLSNYSWNMSDLELVHSEENQRSLVQYWSRFINHEQQILVRRKISIRPQGFDDELIIQNSSRFEQTFTPALSFDADFVDVFELRGWSRLLDRHPVEHKTEGAKHLFFYTAQDGGELSTSVDFEGGRPDRAVKIVARGSHTFTVSVHFKSSVTCSSPPQARINWLSRHLGTRTREIESEGLATAYRDIETLALSTPVGTSIAAGIPNFVVIFGRDSLISAWFLLKEAPDLVRGVLKFLSLHQGRKTDAFHDEEPGKILHEYRNGELSRLNELPFATYYGSIDATALFVRVLADYVRITSDTELARELEPNWRAALKWIERSRDNRGLLKYSGAGDGKGLINKCWKDSSDSMSYGDGSLCQGPLAVVEVQGYMFAAFEAGAWLNDTVQGGRGETQRLGVLRDDTAGAIDNYFWMAGKQTYALAIDEENNQLDVVSSNPGHLLWSGVVPEDKLDLLIKRMFQKDLWSGWGVRTLSANEVRYNPLSYHNGSVWPHDTALFGAGLYRSGRKEAFQKVATALADLAAIQHDRRLPELVGGYERGGGTPPLPYADSCRPQAWAAAALIYMYHPHRAGAGRKSDVAAA